MEQLRTDTLFGRPYATLAAPLLERYEYPWETLGEISLFIREIGKTLSKEVFEKAGEDIWIAKNAKVSASADISGPCIICENAEIRHCAFIRGSVIVGKGAVVGNSTELKNCILFDRVQVPHYNYVGDSILGECAHMGAGAVTSNVKSDKSPVSIFASGTRISTGRKKLGAILGDFAEIGCHAVLNPGTVIGSHSNVYPTSCVRGYIPPYHIFKGADNVVKKTEKLL